MMDPSVAALEAIGLEFAYPGSGAGPASGAGPRAALAGLDLRVGRGEKLAILGPNGAGKTTLLLHLNGTLRPDRGEVRLDGRRTGYDRAALTAWRTAVGLVLQDPDDQIFAGTVAEDVSFGPVNLGLDAGTVRARVAQALEAMRIGELADRPPHHLSFGQRKRVAIAGLLAMAPRVLMLDEPTAGLDGHGTVHLLAALDRLAAGGTTIVFATHDSDLAYAWADTVAVFAGGRTLRQGPPRDVLTDPAIVRAARLRQPWLVEIGLAARTLGLLDADRPLPRSSAEIVALLEDVAKRR